MNCDSLNLSLRNLLCSISYTVTQTRFALILGGYNITNYFTVNFLKFQKKRHCHEKVQFCSQGAPDIRQSNFLMSPCNDIVHIVLFILRSFIGQRTILKQKQLHYGKEEMTSSLQCTVYNPILRTTFK